MRTFSRAAFPAALICLSVLAVSPAHGYADDAALIAGVRAAWTLEEWTAGVTILPRGDRGMAISSDPLQFRQNGVRVYRRDAHGRWRIDRETWSKDHPAVARLSG